MRRNSNCTNSPCIWPDGRERHERYGKKPNWIFEPILPWIDCCHWYYIRTRKRKSLHRNHEIHPNGGRNRKNHCQMNTNNDCSLWRRWMTRIFSKRCVPQLGSFRCTSAPLSPRQCGRHGESTRLDSHVPLHSSLRLCSLVTAGSLQRVDTSPTSIRQRLLPVVPVSTQTTAGSSIVLALVRRAFRISI